MIRVVVVDDQDVVRDGLRLILSAQPDVEVVGEAADGASAIKVVRELRPDVVVMDLRMPGTDGVEATRQLLGAGDLATRVLVLTTFDADEHVVRAVRAGASGFMLKDSPRRQLVDAVRTVAEGGTLLAPAVTRRLVEDLIARPGVDGPPSELARLTDREVEVLDLVVEGLTNAELARQLHLGESTVKTHVGRVLAKLGLTDRVQLVIWAYEHGYVRPGVAGRRPSAHPRLRTGTRDR